MNEQNDYNKIKLLEKIKDPKFYLENFTKVKTKERGLAKFVLKEAQKDLFNALRKSHKLIILKARQLGFSTAVTGFFYHDTITTPGTNTALIGYDSSLTKELLDKVKTFWRTTPVSLRPKVEYNSRFEMSFPELDSKIFVLPSTENVGRGYTIHNALCVHPDTKVVRRNDTGESLVKIKNIRRGDVIVDGENELNKVKEVLHRSFDGFLYVFHIQAFHYEPLKVTYNHKILVKKRYEDEEPVWMAAVDIKVGYYVQHVSTVLNKVTRAKNPFLTKKTWYRIDNIETEQFKGRVYDIALKSDPHSFIANGITIHNCTELAFWTNADEKMAALEAAIPKSGRLVVESCVTGDTLISTSKGLIPIKELHDWDNHEEGFSKGKKIVLDGVFGNKETDTYYNSGVQDGFRITTFSGLELGMSSIHPVMVLRYSLDTRTPKFIKAKDISLNDVVVIKKGRYNFGDERQLTVDIDELGLKAGQVLDKTNYRLIGKNIRSLKKYFEPIKRLLYRSSRSNIEGFLSMLDKKPYFLVVKNRNIHIVSDDLELKKMLQNLFLMVGVNAQIKDESLALSNVADFFDEVNGIEGFLKLNKKYEHKFSRFIVDRVVKKEPIRERVYDFSVPDGHTFISNWIVSHNTPNGVGNAYHRLWVTPNNGYVKKEYGWWWEYSEEEMKEKRASMSELKFEQEYNLKFLSSGKGIFTRWALEKQRANIIKTGEEYDGHIVKEDPNFVNFRIYKYPHYDRQYVVGADTSEGVKGGDYSAAVVFDRETGEEVAFYRGLIKPDDFGVVLNAIGIMYNYALMVPEINNTGISTILTLQKLGYPTMYFRKTNYDSLNRKFTDKIGWRTRDTNRSLMINDFDKAMRESEIIIHSKEIIDECTTFVMDANNKMGAAKGFHDDSVFAAMIAYQGFKSVTPYSNLTQLTEESGSLDHLTYGM